MIKGGHDENNEICQDAVDFVNLTINAINVLAAIYRLSVFLPNKGTVTQGTIIDKINSVLEYFIIFIVPTLYHSLRLLFPKSRILS